MNLTRRHLGRSRGRYIQCEYIPNVFFFFSIPYSAAYWCAPLCVLWLCMRMVVSHCSCDKRNAPDKEGTRPVCVYVCLCVRVFLSYTTAMPTVCEYGALHTMPIHMHTAQRQQNHICIRMQTLYCGDDAHTAQCQGWMNGMKLVVGARVAAVLDVRWWGICCGFFCCLSRVYVLLLNDLVECIVWRIAAGLGGQNVRWMKSSCGSCVLGFDLIPMRTRFEFIYLYCLFVLCRHSMFREVFVIELIKCDISIFHMENSLCRNKFLTLNMIF